MASSVLRHVTSRKLAKLLDAQRQFMAALEAVRKSKPTDVNSLQYSQGLLDTLKILDTTDDKDDKDDVLANMELFLKQAQHDSSIPGQTMTHWQEKMEGMLDARSNGFVYASLFGKLVTEWLEKPNQTSTPPSLAASDDSDDFVPVGRDEMHEQRKTWESIACAQRPVDVSALTRYLTSLFGSAHASQEISPLDILRKKLSFRWVKPLDKPVLKNVISGLLKCDIFTGEKRQSLLELKENEAVLEEMVDVLNVDIRKLKGWRWENNSVPVVLRRQVNGKYRFFLDEEIHQGLLLHYVGATVSQTLREALEHFQKNAWVKRGDTSMTEMARKRRAYFLQQISELGNHRSDGIALDKPMMSVADMRQHEYICNYFLIQMSKTIQGGAKDYSTEQINDSQDSPISIKQGMLECLTTDMHLQLPTRGRFSVLQTDFKWFGPSLPHDTILAVLRFFGFSENLLAFCKTFLKVPMVFAQDGPGGKPMKRTAGAPMSHCLSDAMSETVLFCLDFAVNKATKGDNLIRFHDDLWYWGDVEPCKVVWKTIQDFCKVSGLELNPEKTGSVVITSGKTASPNVTGLPSGAVTWGFLKLDPVHNRWAVDRSQVEPHIAEMRLQLSACRSVFAFVQAWNAYANGFFMNNFGRSAKCHGPEHEKDLLETFQFIQHKLFPSGSVTSHISAMIKETFSVSDVPAGFLHFPPELGGLGLANPFIALMAQYTHPTTITSTSPSDKKPLPPPEIVQACLARERHDYDQARAKYERERHAFRSVQGWTPAGSADFFSFEEYVAPREELGKHFAEARGTLRKRPDGAKVWVSPELAEGIKSELGALPKGWAKKEENKWVVALYGPEFMDKFGRLRVADRELLPIGLVKALRGEKVRWLG